MRVATTATLEEIAEALTGSGPDRAHPLITSWGSVHDDPGPIGSTRTVPDIEPITVTPSSTRTQPDTALPAHQPQQADDDGIPLRETPETANIPESLTARCYWFTHVPAVQKMLGDGAPTVYKLCAADIMLSAMDGTTDLRLLVSSWNELDIRKRIVPAVQALIGGIDRSATIDSIGSDLDLHTADVYLWLLERMIAGRPISTGLSLDSVDLIHVRDPLGGTSVLSNGLHAARLDLRANLADNAKSYGPAYLSVFSNVAEGAFAFQLHINGAFQIDLDASSYYDDETRTIVETRVRQIEDMTHIIIPELQAAYIGDDTWSQRREQSRRMNTEVAIEQLERLRKTAGTTES